MSKRIPGAHSLLEVVLCAARPGSRLVTSYRKDENHNLSHASRH